MSTSEYTRLEFIKRSDHHRKSLKASSGDTKTLYKKLNRLLGNESHDIPRHTDSCKLSEDFKDFFAEKVDKIRRDISATEDEMTPEEIEKEQLMESSLRNMNTKIGNFT